LSWDRSIVKQRRRTLGGAILAIAAMSDQLTPCLGARGQRRSHRVHELASKVCSPCHLVAQLPRPSFMDGKDEYGSPGPLENLLQLNARDLISRSSSVSGAGRC